MSPLALGCELCEFWTIIPQSRLRFLNLIPAIDNLWEMKDDFRNFTNCPTLDDEVMKMSPFAEDF